MQAAPALAAALRGLRGSALTLVGTDVARLGASCLQVLLAARRGWDADGVALRFDDASPALTATAALMGAQNLFDQPEQAS